MTPIARRKGHLFFWLVLALIVTAIGATVLLANDRQNLRRLMDWLGHPLAPSTMAVPRPGTIVTPFKPRPITTVDVMIEPRLMAPEVKGMSASFVRTVFKSGSVICETFRAAGIAVTQWQKSPLGQAQMECYAETIIANPDKPDEPSSFFLMVKGAPDGALQSSRIKIVISSVAGRDRVVRLAANAAATYGRATGWLEMVDSAPDILRLTPFEIENFGTRISFSSEFGGPGRYNLIITVKPRTPEEKRTQAFFDRSRFMPMLPDVAAGGDLSRKTDG